MLIVELILNKVFRQGLVNRIENSLGINKDQMDRNRNRNRKNRRVVNRVECLDRINRHRI